MIFLFVAGEALLMSVAGGLLGALLARLVVTGDLSRQFHSRVLA